MEEKATIQRKRAGRKRQAKLFDGEKEPVEQPKPKKYKSTMLFDYLSNILQEKSMDKYRYHVEKDDFQVSFEGYMVLRFLSMHKSPLVRNVVVSNQIALERMTPKAMYRFLLEAVPRSSPFIKYIKPATEENRK